MEFVMAIRNLILFNIKLTDLWLIIEFQMTHNAIKFKANFLLALTLADIDFMLSQYNL